MAQVTKTDLEAMDYLYQGEPFCNVPAKNTIELTTLDFVYQGEPFNGYSDTATGAGGGAMLLLGIG